MVKNTTEHIDPKIDTLYALLAKPASVGFSEYVRRKLDEIGITQNTFCRITGIDNKTLNRILSGEAQKVDLITLIILGQFLGVDYKELAQLYVGELEQDGVRKLQVARKAGFILKHFDIKSLKKIGFIPDEKNFDEIERRIIRFFRYETLFEYEHSNQRLLQLFSKVNRTSSEKMLQFWCVTAFNELKAIDNPYPYDDEQVKQVIARLSILTNDEIGGLLSAVTALFRAGVTVVVNPYLNKTQIRGGTFWVNEKPAIVLQDFRKKYSTIWFALAHELCHVMKDMDRIRHLKYHISFEDEENAGVNMFIDRAIEQRADNFASEILLPESKLRFIAPNIDIPGMVRKSANSWQVSESIIYGQYAKKYGKPFYYSKDISAEPAVRELLINPYEKEDIDAAVKELSHIYC